MPVPWPTPFPPKPAPKKVSQKVLYRALSIFVLDARLLPRDPRPPFRLNPFPRIDHAHTPVFASLGPMISLAAV